MEQPSLGQLLSAVEPHLDSTLASEDSWEVFRGIADVLPFVDVAFEIRLTPPSPQVDFSVRLTRNDIPRLVAMRRRHSASRHDPRWGTAERLAGAWTANDEEWSSKVDSLWLEFDVVPGAAITPAPMPFVLFKAHVDARDPGKSESIVRCLQDDGDRRMLEAVKQVLEAVPADVSVRALGALDGRPGAPFRIALSPQANAEASATVRRLGLVDRASIARRHCESAFQTCALFLDVQGGRTVRVGRAYQKDALHARLDWGPILDALAADGLCDRATAAAVKAWMGVQVIEAHVDCWPRELADAAVLLGSRVRTGLLRDAFRLKLVDYEGGTQLKMYLGALRTLVARRAG